MRRRPFRLWELVTLTAVLLGVVALIAPHQIGLAVWKLGLVTLAGTAGYWLDRTLFPYARPHLFAPMRGEEWQATPTLAMLMAASMIRRAVIVAAAMMAVATGL